jgi:hypothetical protein
MIELTEEQRRQIKEGEPVAIDPETREVYVLVPKEVYDRWRHLWDDDMPGKREVAALVARAMREYDANDPSLHLYQDD